MSQPLLRWTVIGAGTIGSEIALVALEDGGPVEVADADHTKLTTITMRDHSGRLEVGSDNRQAVESADIVVLAIKPQDFATVASEIGGALTNQTVVSVMAGIPLSTLQSSLGVAGVVRVAPNLPIVARLGFCIWYSTAEVPATHRERIEALLSRLGTVIEGPNEELLDLGLAVSGAGPGFAYLFMEALQAGAMELGADTRMARQMALQAVLGAAGLAGGGQLAFDELRAKVTSKGGTTAAGIAKLEQAGFRETVIQAVRATYARGQELNHPSPRP